MAKIKKDNSAVIGLNEVLFIMAVAFVARIIPVLNGTEWTDLYEQQAVPILEHLNIYSSTHLVFPYSPVSMFLPALCAKISLTLGLPFNIVMKLPSIIADLCISASIYIVMVKLGLKKAYLWSLLYALNPVSVMITAFHGNIISIATLFSFLAYAVLLFGVEKYYRLSALLLGLGIGFRGYPILLLPVFLLGLNLPFKKRAAYFLYATVPTALSFIPFLILDYRAVFREVFAYSGFMDYGLGAILRAVYSFRTGTLYYGFPDGLHIRLADGSKIVFFVIYLVILAMSLKRRRLIYSILSVFLLFYFVYTGISSQYLVWVLPFAFLIKDRMLKYYVIFATWALVNFYWIYHPQILFGKLPEIKLPLRYLLTGEIVSLSIFWLLCLAWPVRLLIRAHKEPEYDFL